ncbi:hypothetical protein EYC84_007170 [Monilinia fructicola]|uniref:Uncharacterized protein n=1 Tax=Monilinia fructicola TaxID=38448 RepID=A0A5M9K5S1_MONFR|nr:hypothetical protein EYC84_007170 [Monilinia fructicola]
MSSPARRSPASPTFPEAPKESAVVRFIIAPITFISFLISLFLIDRRNSSLRLHQHSQPRTYPDTFVGRIREFLHKLVFKPQPYAYIKSPSRGPNAEGDKQREEEPWHWRTKQKKMMKMEVADAFKLRQWVLRSNLEESKYPSMHWIITDLQRRVQLDDDDDDDDDDDIIERTVHDIYRLSLTNYHHHHHHHQRQHHHSHYLHGFRKKNQLIAS